MSPQSSLIALGGMRGSEGSSLSWGHTASPELVSSLFASNWSPDLVSPLAFYPGLEVTPTG